MLVEIKWKLFNHFNFFMWQDMVHKLVDKQLKATVCHEVLNRKDKVQQDSYTVIYMSSIRHNVYKLYAGSFNWLHK